MGARLAPGRDESLVDGELRGDVERQGGVVERGLTRGEVRVRSEPERARGGRQVRDVRGDRQAVGVERVRHLDAQGPRPAGLGMEGDADGQPVGRALHEIPGEPLHETVRGVRQPRFGVRQEVILAVERVPSAVDSVGPRREDVSPRGVRHCLDGITEDEVTLVVGQAAQTTTHLDNGCLVAVRRDGPLLAARGGEVVEGAHVGQANGPVRVGPTAHSHPGAGRTGSTRVSVTPCHVWPSAAGCARLAR